TITLGAFVLTYTHAHAIPSSVEADFNGDTLTLPAFPTRGPSDPDHATTSGNGGYLFTEAPGTYTVTVDASNFAAGGALAGYNASPNLGGSHQAIDSTTNPSVTTPNTQPGGSTDLTIDIGHFTNPT